MTCSQSGCSWPPRYDGLCGAHYLRRSLPDPTVELRDRTVELRDRFEAKITRTPECWEWAASRLKANGYGQFSVKQPDGKWRPVVAHRVAYELYYGPIPNGLLIRHRCNNPGCVNPDHLEALTARQLALHSNAPTAVAMRENRCTRGHEFTPENTRVRAKGRRECRECVRARERAYRQKGRRLLT